MKKQELIGDDDHEEKKDDGQDSEMKEEEKQEESLEIQKLEKDAGVIRNCEVNSKVKVRKLKEAIAVELGLKEEDASNIRLFYNGVETEDDK